MLHRLPRASLLLLALAAACGTDPVDPDQPEPIDAGQPEPDAPQDPIPVIRNFSVTIPPTGETIGFELKDYPGSSWVSVVTAKRPPAKLRLIKISEFRNANTGLLGDGTLAEKCATFDANASMVTNYGPLEWGVLDFKSEYGPDSDELRAAIRAELVRNGWLPDGGYNYRWPAELWPNVEGRIEFLAGARSPGLMQGTKPLVQVANENFGPMFGFVARTGSGSVRLPIAVVCDLSNGKAVVHAKVTSTPPIALPLILNP